jgi:hypothetical protein
MSNNKQNDCMIHIAQICNNQQHRKHIWHISVSVYGDSLIHKLSSVHNVRPAAEHEQQRQFWTR